MAYSRQVSSFNSGICNIQTPRRFHDRCYYQREQTNYTMSEHGTGADLRETLHKRSELLQAVANQPHTKPELIDVIGKSRSTVDRSVEDLEAVDCIERRDGAYCITMKGKLALTEYTSYSGVTNSIEAAGDILNHLPEESTISRDFLKDVTVHQADPRVPGTALEESNKLLQASTRMIGLAPTAPTWYPEILGDVVRNQSLTVEIVVEEAVFQSLSDVKGDEIASLAAHDEVTFYTFQDSLPYALWVMDQGDSAYAGITVYENGGVQGILVNNSTEAVTWAKGVYQEYQQQSTSAARSLLS